MLIAARENEGPALRRGCIAVATSADLKMWQVHEPLWRPRLTHVMECPELFQLGAYWYLVFSRYSEDAQTVYRRLALAAWALGGKTTRLSRWAPVLRGQVRQRRPSPGDICLDP